MRTQVLTRPNAVPVHAGQLAILSTRHETRVVRVLSRAADICLDWKVEVLGSPAWMVDARTKVPALTNVGFARAQDLHAFEDSEEVSYA